LNAPGAFGYPLTTWGARVKFEPVEAVYAMVGCYNGDPGVKAATVTASISRCAGRRSSSRGRYRRKLRQGRYEAARQREMRAYFNGGSALVFDSGLAGRPSETVQARYGFYVWAIRRWRAGATRRRSATLGAFAAFVCAPDQRVNTVPYFFDAGLVAYGFFAGSSTRFCRFRRGLRLVQRRPCGARSRLRL